MVFRFGNGIFEPIWNRRYIDHVQITVAETLGVEGRGGYYDTAGALRDMVPNHMAQLLAWSAMEPPISFERGRGARRAGEAAHAHPAARRREEVLSSAVRGQYGAGRDRRASRCPRYREEEKVAAGLATPRPSSRSSCSSTTGAGRTCPSTCAPASACPKRDTEIAIQFKRAPFMLFRDTPVDRLTHQPPRHPHPARRGHLAALRGQGAGPGADAWAR